MLKSSGSASTLIATVSKSITSMLPSLLLLRLISQSGSVFVSVTVSLGTIAMSIRSRSSISDGVCYACLAIANTSCLVYYCST